MAGDDWTSIRLGKFVTLQRGHDLPERERRSGKVPVVGSFGITGYHDTPVATGPGVTVGRSGTSLGVVSYVPNDYWPLNTALYVIDFHGNDPRFAYYLLKSMDFSHYNSGSAQPSLNRNFIHPIEIRVPTIHEQSAIAATLGWLDDRIDLNGRMSGTLAAIAGATFKSWFVDFDAVRLKAEGRPPPALDSTTASLFPDSFENSPLGEIPKGWVVATATNLLSLGREVIDPGEFLTEVFDHYSIPAFDEGRVPHAQLGDQIKSNKFLVPSSCVLLSKLNPRIPRVWLPAARQKGRAVCSTEFLLALPRPGVPVEFLYCLLGSRSFLDVFATLVTGTSGSHQRVRPEDLLGMATLLPPPEIVARFAEAVRPMLRTAECHLAESQTLTALRDTLLPKLLSGEVRIKDAEKLVSAAT